MNQTAKILKPNNEEGGIACAKAIEYAGRNCYASQDKIGDDSYVRFIHSLINRGHDAPLEFADMTVDITTSRAVLAELTRHRLSNFCVESQRYINESGKDGITFIYPEWYTNKDKQPQAIKWFSIMQTIEEQYNAMIKAGMKPEEAREILPNSTACRIIMKANLREWRHIFDLRCSNAAYPQMRSLMRMILEKADRFIPVVFEDLYNKYILGGN